MKLLLLLSVMFGLIFGVNFNGEFIYAANKNYQIYIHDFGINGLVKGCGDDNDDEKIDLNSYIFYVGNKKYYGKKEGSEIHFAPIAVVSYNDSNVTVKMLLKKTDIPIIKKMDIDAISYYDENTCYIKSEFRTDKDTNETELSAQKQANFSSLSYIIYLDENITTYQTFVSNFNGVHPTFHIINRVVDANASAFDIRSVYDLNKTELIEKLKNRLLTKFKIDNNITNDDDAKAEFFDFDAIEFNDNFAITKNEISFYYSQCELLPCINDGISVSFDFKELENYKK
ncbi:hypothetical protein GO117_02815 [Campylobacter fetus]|nr:hypothetical protein [Campylobacter fetus]EJU9540069.1 DUF3298 domain-containing protein [Campylobacter fetus]